jgi:hypothetical protein
MEKHDANIEHLYRDSAERFKALSRLFGQLGSAEAAQRLLESLISEDAKAFARLIEPVNIPDLSGLGKCFWLREIIERVLETPKDFVEECWLRDNLTSQERVLFVQIALRHNEGRVIAGPGMEGTLRRRIILPGAFLNELKANRLVTCVPRPTYAVGLAPVLGKPERICV